MLAERHEELKLEMRFWQQPERKKLFASLSSTKRAAKSDKFIV
jgi:hypothetical protein